MFRFAWLSDIFAVVAVPRASHIGDLDAGITMDWTSLSSGWSVISNFPRQGAIVAMATQVSPTAIFGAEPHWRLKRNIFIAKSLNDFSFEVNLFTFC